MKYIPKGGMCATCINIDRNCTGLEFSKMPVISRTDDLTIVKCTEYERKNCPIENPKKLKPRPFCGGSEIKINEEEAAPEVEK